MKNNNTNILIYLLCFMLFQLNAEETGFSSYFGTYGLSDYESSDTEYSPYFQWGANIYYKESSGVDNSLGYNLELDIDPLLKYRVKSEIEFNQPFYSLSFGPVFGVINQSKTLVKPGFSGDLKVRVPGRAYIDLGGELIPSRSYLLDKDYSSYSGFYTIGFYLKRDHILCYFTQKSDLYSEIEDSEESTASRTSYIFYTDYFEKNSLVKIQSKLGYEKQDKILPDGTSFEIKNILMGMRFDFFIDGSTAYLGLDNRLYPVTSGSVELNDVPGYLFTFSTGFILYR